MKKSIIFGALSLTFLLTSCATIVSGSKQTVKFTSNPSTAYVFLDDKQVGSTPFETKLERKKSHNVKIKLEGYQTYEITLTRKFNAWYIGNLLFGGLIGIIVDPITGAMYKLTPSEVNAELGKGTAFKLTNKEIYIGVALNIDPNWKKIGQLEKVND
ncbi:PEGA domain-containing protein [Flavobacterium sp.]|uniref:PEGA domain-containing protein n=1 Tax=Flavobacterium sp. TaxID=239 RepID=UPI0037510C52